jgi:hypothetical protein
MKTIKTTTAYIIAVLTMGIFTGLVMSMGTRIIASIIAGTVMWAMLLAPMLIKEK